MSIGLVGRKVGMTRIFTDDGATLPVTVIDVSDNRVTQIKTAESDGYAAVQVGFGKRLPRQAHARPSRRQAAHERGPDGGARRRRAPAAARQGLRARRQGPRRRRAPRREAVQGTGAASEAGAREG